MAKTNNTESTRLSISKIEFEKEIDELISKGNDIINYEIRTLDHLLISKDSFSHWYDYSREYLKQKFNKENNEYKKGFEDAGAFIFTTIRSPKDEVNHFQTKVKAKIDFLIRLKTKIKLLKSEAEKEISSGINQPKSKLDLSKVFIVHGHDEAAKMKAARFVERLGFAPIILHEQASGSKTVIEKIEEYSNVGFGIVLYTSCDTGAKKEEKPNYRNRARQNVVFEHGFLIGKIGRKNVCALVKDDIETPNDISGVIYIKMDNEDAWHLKLARELRNSGYQVDMNKL